MTVPPPAPAFCTEVTPDCPVEGTIYGYYPSLGWNAAYAGLFGLALVIHIILGIRYKTWSYCIAMSLGCIGEVVGYIGRVMMWDNPFSEAGFQMQICCLIIAPAFISAAIYLTLKHIVYSFGESWSRLRPTWYTWIFIGCDLISLVLQGAGGGIAATADFGSELQDVGTDLMLAGVVWQVVCLTFFGYSWASTWCGLIGIAMRLGAMASSFSMIESFKSSSGRSSRRMLPSLPVVRIASQSSRVGGEVS
jgi:hypothetical protein